MSLNFEMSSALSHTFKSGLTTRSVQLLLSLSKKNNIIQERMFSEPVNQLQKQSFSKDPWKRKRTNENVSSPSAIIK